MQSLVFLSLISIISATEMFVKIPKSTHVLENDTAKFICEINPSSYRIFWWVDERDVSLTRIQNRGVRITFYNDTYSELSVFASINNDNSKIQCEAIWFHARKSTFAEPAAFLTVYSFNNCQRNKI